MARVKAFTVDGVRMTMPSGDHEPAHFHARKGSDWKARVYFQRPRGQMIELIGPPGARIGKKDRKALVEGAERHRPQLLSEWEQCNGSGQA